MSTYMQSVLAPLPEKVVVDQTEVLDEAARTIIDPAGFQKKVKDGLGFFVIPEIVGAVDGDNLDVTTVSTIADAARIADGAVPGIATFTSTRVLKCVVDFPDLFPFSMTVLEGYPGCLYSPEFKDLTFNFDTMSYEQLVLEVAAAKRADAALKQDRRTEPAIRDELTTRASGHKRRFNRFDVTEPGSAADDAPGDEEDGSATND